jgi:hypothetical protein
MRGAGGNAAGARTPSIRTRLEPVECLDGQRQWEVVVEVDALPAGMRGLPPRMKAQAHRHGAPGCLDPSQHIERSADRESTMGEAWHHNKTTMA